MNCPLLQHVSCPVVDQPTQGSYPDSTNVSVLDHTLAGEQTISQEKGLFLKDNLEVASRNICVHFREFL